MKEQVLKWQDLGAPTLLALFVWVLANTKAVHLFFLFLLVEMKEQKKKKKKHFLLDKKMSWRRLNKTRNFIIIFCFLCKTKFALKRAKQVNERKRMEKKERERERKSGTTKNNLQLKTNSNQLLNNYAKFPTIATHKSATQSSGRISCSICISF